MKRAVCRIRNEDRLIGAAEPNAEGTALVPGLASQEAISHIYPRWAPARPLYGEMPSETVDNGLSPLALR